MAVPALGIPIEIDRSQSLTRFQFYLGLVDALRCREHPQSDHLRELADSFSHDILNIAALAGRLLWYEGVTPELWRSHDLIAVSVDTEAYYVMLQSACDIMADVIATLAAKRGQAPHESFHKLNEWALKNPVRLDAAYQRLAVKELPWFRKINLQRTNVVHRGESILVYTNRVSFNCGTLIEELGELTHSMLDFSERLGLTVLGEKARENNRQKSVIDGVYVPALYHLLNEYKVPKKSSDLKLEAQCLIACGGYVEAAYLGYPSGFWWKALVYLIKGMSGKPISANIPVNMEGSVHDCRFVISAEKRAFGIIVCDRGYAQNVWITEAAESAKKFESDSGVYRTALIVREMQGTPPKYLPNTRIALIVGKKPSDFAKAFVRATSD